MARNHSWNLFLTSSGMIQKWIRNSLLPAFLVIGLLAIAVPLISEDSKPGDSKTESDKKETENKLDLSKMTDLKVVLKGDDGMPVVGASVTPYAMRMKGQNGHGYWNDEKFGPPKAALSDQQGEAVIRYPSQVDVGSELYTTSLVTFQIEHSDYVPKTVHFDLGPPQAEVTLQPGCEVQLSAVDEAGNPVNKFAVLMAGPHATTNWVDDGQNGRRTRAMKDGKWQTILVSIPEKGPTLFSGVMPLAVRPKQAVKLRNIRLLPGARVFGKLSDNVPRPIKEGRIIATSAPKPADSSYAENDPSIVWHECTGIDEKGEFELPSLPRGGEVQVIAICDGWLSKTTIKEANGFFVAGQLFPIDSEEVSLIVDMEQTGVLDITVKKPDGSPLEGATVAAWPNQMYYKGGSTVLGQEINSRDSVIHQLTPLDQRVRKARAWSTLFSQKTGKAGTAILKGMPVGRGGSVTVLHPSYELPLDNQKQHFAVYHVPSPKAEQLELVTLEVKAAAKTGEPK
jgi:hypothetical protein